MSETQNHNMPVAIHENWRAWLMTGSRLTPVDRRRMRGAHRGLKKILLEGLAAGESPHAWMNFSGAMVRHAVDDAMRTLPDQDTQVVKLAYFGGYSNREIAREIGLTEGTVQRRLSRALAAISDHIQHGRVTSRRILYGLGLFLSGRWLNDTAQHLWTATAVAGAAAVIIVTQPAPVIGDTPAAPGTHSVAPSLTVVPPVPSPTLPVTVPAGVPAAAPQLPAATNPVAVPPVPVVGGLPVAVPSPSIPPLPKI